MSWTVWRVIGGAVLLSIPVALLLYALGKPAIQILFQHEAFNAHAAALTNTALLGFAIGLPGQTLGLLIVLSFYALKDALTPLFINVFELGAHIGLAVFLLRILKGDNAILALPMAASLSATVAAAALCLILFLRLRAKMRMDRGMQRLLQRRRHLQMGANGRTPQLIVPYVPPENTTDVVTPLVGTISGRQVTRQLSLPFAVETPGHLRRAWLPQGGSLHFSHQNKRDKALVPTSNSHNTLVALVQQHIALISNPGTDPVIILEMLATICQQLRGEGQHFYDRVMDEYEQTTMMYANIASFQFVLGQLYQQRGSYDKAVDAYMLAMRNSPFEVIARINAAQCLLQVGLPGVAILQLQQALQSIHSTSASPIQAHMWEARPREENEILQATEVVISQLLARATESKERQEQMRNFLRRVNQTPSSYHEVVPAPRQFAIHHDYGSGLLHQVRIQQEPDDIQTYDELADIYKIQGVLHETIAKLCEQVVIYLHNNQPEQARAAIQRIGALYAQLGSIQEAHTHMHRAEELASNKLTLLQ
jgi:tetratricopeptide (TPR) repeat protein